MHHSLWYSMDISFLKKKDIIDNNVNICLLISDIISGIVFFVCYFFITKTPEDLLGLFLMYPLIKITLGFLVGCLYYSVHYFKKPV